MFRISLFCLLAMALSACISMPGSAQMLSVTQTATDVLTATITTKSTVTITSPTATIIQTSPTRRPKIDPATAATQAVAIVETSQIIWSGSISAPVFRQLRSQESGGRESFQAPESEVVFSLSARPVIIAAYIYKVSSEEKRHARFLLYEPGGKWGDEIVPPFLYKMDLPLSWIGGHEDYGNYDELILGLETQFEHSISPNKLSIGVFSAKHCADANGVHQQLCAELDRQGIKLPVDYDAAKAVVMDQWNLAIQRTTMEVGDVEQVVEPLNASGTTWWEDNRFVLFYLPPITVCLPEDPPLCGAYISYEMRIDTFGLLRQ